MIVITSKSNPIVHKAIQLKDKKYIKESCECLVESEKIVYELSQKAKLSTIIVDSAKKDKFDYILKDFDGQIVCVSPKICEYIADSKSPSGIFGFAKVDLVNTDIVSGNCIVLDCIQDPGNLGAMIRSALAFGFSDVFLINSVFPYSFKVIRASMGYVFDVKIHDVSYENLERIMSENDIKLVVADMGGTPADRYKPYSKIALVVGNEGNGVSDNIKKMNLDTVSIPMQNGVESLNASVSASILMYYFKSKE